MLNNVYYYLTTFLGLLTIKDWPDMLSRNVVKRLLVYSAYNPRSAEIPTSIHSTSNVAL